MYTCTLWHVGTAVIPISCFWVGSELTHSVMHDRSRPFHYLPLLSQYLQRYQLHCLVTDTRVWATCPRLLLRPAFEPCHIDWKSDNAPLCLHVTRSLSMVVNQSINRLQLWFITVISKTVRCINRDELWERNSIQLDVLQDSQWASQLVHSCQQMSL